MAFRSGKAIISPLMIDPPPSKYYASAFRETNIGSQKELEQSVLWRAGQNLHSAFSAFIIDVVNYHHSYITTSIDVAAVKGADPVEESFFWLYTHTRMLDIFHPVVVIRARLWMAKEKGVEEIPWCRFVQYGYSGESTWWYDVVNVQHFQDYANEITQYYRRNFRKVKAGLL